MGQDASLRRRVRPVIQRRKNDVVYVLAWLGVGLCRRLPHRMGLALGAALGGLAFRLLGKERRRALEHLAIAFGSEKTAAERERIARECFRNMGRNAVEVVNYPRFRERLDAQVAIEGVHHLDAALARGRGLVYITAHLGNWELMACQIARRGYRVNVVAREVYDPRLNRLLLRFREEESVRVILRESPSAGREILRCLRRGEVLGMLIDQDTTVKGVMADFFGRKANTPAGAAIIARRRSVPVVAGFIHRESSGAHRIEICPEIPPVRTDDVGRDVQRMTEAYNRVIERFIRAHPEQWVWNHRRWRRRSAYEGPLVT